MIFPLSATSQSLDVEILDDSGLPVTGLLAATFPTLTYSLAGANADVAFPALSDLATITTAYSSGGVKERGNGVYRLDLPNGVFTTAGQVRIRGEATGKHVICPWLEVGNVPADAKAINAVSTSSVTAVNANVGTTQPIAFGADNLPKVGIWGFLGTLFTESVGGNIAAAFKKAFDVASSVWTTASVNQTGDSFARIGANGGALTALAPASTALSNVNWTNARAGYLDNINVGGAVASHADVVAINQSASKHLLLVTVGQYEPGETYTVEMRTFAASDGSAVNADSTPTLAATGQVSGSLSANLSVATNPATGVYRWTYTPGASPTLEQIRFDGSATISAATFTLSCYAQTIDEATAVFTSTDQSHLTSIFNKLPANNIADETLLAAAIALCQQAGAAVTLPANPPSGFLVSASFAAACDFTSTQKTSLSAATPSVTVSDKTGFKLASDGIDAIVVETGLNARQALSINSAASAGVLAGAATATVTIAAAGVPATNRITASVDADGNRSSVTLRPPA